MNYPKISCILICRQRPNLSSFLSQTYRNKEIVVVSNEDFELDDVINIQAPRATVNELRCLACELTSGDIICEWDDGPYPEWRLVEQYNLLRRLQLPSKLADVDFSHMFDKKHYYDSTVFDYGKIISKLKVVDL